MFKLIAKTLALLAIVGWVSSASAAPITDTVTVAGKEWAQVDLFTNLTWSDINTVCPGGVCGNSTLNGFEMDGWTWATIDNLNDLFNHYIGFAALGPGPDRYAGGYRTFTDVFYADGWRWLDLGLRAIVGRISDDERLTPTMLSIPGGVLGNRAADNADTSLEPVIWNSSRIGAWFVRAPVEVPVPASLPLLALGLAVIGFNRRQPGKRYCRPAADQ